MAHANVDKSAVASKLFYVSMCVCKNNTVIVHKPVTDSRLTTEVDFSLVISFRKCVL